MGAVCHPPSDTACPTPKEFRESSPRYDVAGFDLGLPPQILPTVPRTPLCRQISAFLSAWALVSTASAERLVVGRGTAEPAYLEQRRLPDGTTRRETYVFMPGIQRIGMTADRSLEKKPFPEIARVLAPDLKRQNYHPAESAERADLLLVVHWGVTDRIDRDEDLNLSNLDAVRELRDQIEESLQREQAVVSGDGSASDLMNTLLGAEAGRRSDAEARISHETATLRNAARGFHGAGGTNAQILGLAPVLSRERNSILASDRHRALHEMTTEERYFVVVMAYDLPALLKSGKLRRQWTARASIRSGGVNFHTAIERISTIAGTFFGARTDDVVMERAGARQGRVELGEFKIIGVEPSK